MTPPDDNPSPTSPIPPKVILILFALFFILPALCCGGCTFLASRIPTPAEMQRAR